MSKHKRIASHHHETVKTHAKALVAATGHITDGKVSELRDKLNDVIDNVSDKIENMEEAAVEKAKQADKFVREQPYKTAAIALGIGALIGLYIARKK